MTLSSYPLLGLIKDIAEYHRATIRGDKITIANNYNQIIERCAKIAGKPLITTKKEKKKKAIDEESVNQARIIINKNTDAGPHTNVREIFEISDEESIWFCNDCHLLIFVDFPNEWAHSRRAADGYEAYRNRDNEKIVEGCND